MRLELFFKTPSQLSAWLSVLNDHNQHMLTGFTGNAGIAEILPYTVFNIPNKVRNENLLPYAEQILNMSPSADISIHYSVKNNKFKTMTESLNHFKSTMSNAASMGVKEILLVSGSGDPIQKRIINAVSVLEALQKENYQLPTLGNSNCLTQTALSTATQSLALSCAFNPYCFTPQELEVEQQRLIQKVNTGFISTIYLQFGTELALLKQAIEFIQNNILSQSQYSHITVYGSVFLPSKQLLNRMKFRPWKGLYLSPEFLNDVVKAEEIVKDMLVIYKEMNVQLIIETAVKTDKEFQYMEDLIRPFFASCNSNTTPSNSVEMVKNSAESDVLNKRPKTRSTMKSNS